MDGSRWVVRWLPGAERSLTAHRAAGQQLDDLCAVHQVAVLLQADGMAVDPEALALDAGTLLPPEDGASSVPPGARPRRDYRRSLPRAPTRATSGTALPGLIEATAARSEGRQALVPLRTSWTADTVETTVELCRDHPAWRAVPLANVRTGKLWGSTPGIEAATAWLAGSDIPGPPPDWDVGHFVAIVGTIDGDRRSLLLVRDSYPAFGWDGHHLQPPEAVASALERGDGREGGVALYVDAGDREDVERAAKEAGFDIAAWDNGTPWPPSGEEGADR